MSYSMNKNSKLVNLVENHNMDSMVILLSVIVAINVLAFYFNSFLGSSVMYLNVLHGLSVLVGIIFCGNKKIKNVFKFLAVYVLLEYYAKELSSNIKMVLDIVNCKISSLCDTFMGNNKLYIDFSLIIQNIIVLTALCLLVKFVFVFFKKGEITSLEKNNDVKTLFKSFTHKFLIKNENYGFRYNAIP